MAVDLTRCDRYLCLMFRLLLILSLMILPAAVQSAATGEVSPGRPAEYMIYQYAGVSMVVKIDAPELDFESTIYGPEDALIKTSRVPASRIGPLYQFIDAVDIPRQLMIHVNPDRGVDRSGISLELIQLPERDRNSTGLSQAYRLLSYGTESIHSNDSTTWSMKVYTLRNAARAFATLGWEEMRLWSEFYAAHFVLHQLGDEVLALELSREIYTSARRAGFEPVELAALILEADALIAAGNTPGRVAQTRLEQAHGALDRVVLMADRLQLKSEQARALFKDGLVYETQDRLEQAVEQFQRALDVSLSSNNPELVNEIRGKAADAYETLGSTTGAIEMLRDIGEDLGIDAESEIAANLAERGRLLNSEYRYAEAVQELTQALEMQRSSSRMGSWGPTGLELAWAHYSLGDRARAAGLIVESIPRTTLRGNRAALIRAYSSLAHVYRESGDFAQMSDARNKQGELVQTERQRTEHAFDAAMDAWHDSGAESGRAADLLAGARRQALASGDSLFASRARLHQCLLQTLRRGGEVCTADELRQLRRGLVTSGLPVLALEADFVTARILRLKAEPGEALSRMESVLDEIRFLRLQLPGVLGAWYWNNRSDLFREFMALNLDLSGVGREGSVDGAPVLLALNRIRLIETDEQRIAGETTGPQAEAIRSLLARRGAAGAMEGAALAQQVNSDLNAYRDRLEPGLGSLTPAGLERLLSGFSRDESLLTYYFTDAAVYILIGGSKGVSLSKVPATGAIADRLYELRDRIGGSGTAVLAGLDAMGRALLAPFIDDLGEKIFLLPAGPLNGFPFNVLRLNGKFLAESHDVVNLVSLSPFESRRRVGQQEIRKRVFLAGNPQTERQLFSYDVQVSPEISRMTDRFVGPGLHIVQGVALTKEEFADERFTEAGLIHLAMPGTLDLAFPERSVLVMSRSGNAASAGNLFPRDLRGLSFEAGLAVLSQTAATGSGRSVFDSRMGFVSDFLNGGVRNVLVNLAFEGEAASVEFLEDFYTALEASGDVAEALSNARKARLDSLDDANFRKWAGFQLFIR